MKHTALVAILASVSAAAPHDNNNNDKAIVASECKRYSTQYGFNETICLDVGNNCFDQGNKDGRDLLECIWTGRAVPEAENRCKWNVYANIDKEHCRDVYKQCYKDRGFLGAQDIVDDCARKGMGFKDAPTGYDMASWVRRTCIRRHTDLEEEECVKRYEKCWGSSLPVDADFDGEQFARNKRYLNKLIKTCNVSGQ